MSDSLRIVVLGGGPDREREVSLHGAACVAKALRKAGHAVHEAQIAPDNLAALRMPCDVVFPVLHGRWGEGGALQRLLELRKLRYVGSRPKAAWVAMDKLASKQAAVQVAVPTAEAELLSVNQRLTLEPPVVLKSLTEGSSFGIEICRDIEHVVAARRRLHAHFAFIMAEQFIAGRELTVGIVGDEALPILEVVPAGAYYDYAAKYQRDDTRYVFDLDLPDALLERVRHDALAVHRKIGCRHYSRVDFIIDAQQRPWFLEINTIPGFTDHSLLPKAAAQAGLTMPAMCDRLVRLAMDEASGR